MQNIIEIEVRNIRGIKVVCIQPGPAVTKITGPNEAGKTSFMDGIAYCLGGERLIPAQPIRDGESTGHVQIKFSTYTVRRDFKRLKNPKEHSSSFTIKSLEGATFASPQTMLNEALAPMTFDPMEFTKKSAKEQETIVGRLVGIDIEEFKSRRKVVFDQRTDLNRRVKDLDAQLKGLPIIEAPEKEQDIEELSKKLEDAQGVVAANKQEHEVFKHMEEKYVAIANASSDVSKRIAELESQLCKAKEERTRYGEMLETQQSDNKAAFDALAYLIDPDVDAIRSKFATVGEINANVRHNKLRADKWTEREALQKQADSRTEHLEQIDAEKSRAIANSDLPGVVEGLSLDEDGVQFDGRPFAQAPMSRQIRVSAAIVAADHPDIRLMLIRNGGDLDDERMVLLNELAKEMKMQCG